MIATGNRRLGLSNCEESLASAVKISNATAVFRSRLALLQAKLANGDRGGAVNTFHEIEPELGRHPESRWLAFALMAQVDSSYANPARQALLELSRLWGATAYQTYIGRPDLEKLSRPLLERISAFRQ